MPLVDGMQFTYLSRLQLPTKAIRKFTERREPLCVIPTPGMPLIDSPEYVDEEGRHAAAKYVFRLRPTRLNSCDLVGSYNSVIC